MPRQFRFATVAAPSTPFKGLIEQARAAEASGFDLLVLPDFPNTISPIVSRHSRRLVLTPSACGSARWW